mmetsp:Transcript_27801/g.62743  ORF Transcript_27801/g.62743 Transcript_27801/m.62743 type:complete len:292 (+) Transcript_27801:66-941(+)
MGTGHSLCGASTHCLGNDADAQEAEAVARDRTAWADASLAQQLQAEEVELGRLAGAVAAVRHRRRRGHSDRVPQVPQVDHDAPISWDPLQEEELHRSTAGFGPADWSSGLLHRERSEPMAWHRVHRPSSPRPGLWILGEEDGRPSLPRSWTRWQLESAEPVDGFESDEVLARSSQILRRRRMRRRGPSQGMRLSTATVALFDLLADLDPSVGGLDPATLDANTTTLTYGSGGSGQENGKAEVQSQCVVCLEQFKSGEKLRMLPCLHRYHASCVDQWFALNSTCPVCKYQVA